MESFSPNVIGPTGYGNDNSTSALASGLMAAAALSKNGYVGEGYDGLSITAMDGICDLRHDVQQASAEIRHDVGATRETVKDAECNIRHDVTKAESEIRRDVVKEGGDMRRDLAKTEADLNKELGNLKFQLHDNISQLGQNTNNRFGLVDVAIVRAEYEAKLGAEKVIKEVSMKVDHESERTNDKLIHGFEKVGKQLDNIEKYQREDKIADLKQTILQLSQDKQTAELSRLICCGCGGDALLKK